MSEFTIKHYPMAGTVDSGAAIQSYLVPGVIRETDDLVATQPTHSYVPGPLLSDDRLVLVCACGSLWIVNPEDSQYHGHRDFYEPNAQEEPAQ